MQTNIEKLRSDIRAEQSRWKMDVARIVISIVGLVIGAFAAGAAWWNYLGHH